MKLSTIRTPLGMRTVRLGSEHAEVVWDSDLGSLLSQPSWETLAQGSLGERYPLEDLDFAPLVPSPSKIVCVGLNYRTHIEEMGRALPGSPTLFLKVTETLIGAKDQISLPPETASVDWEAELVVVVGRRIRRGSLAEAEASIAGFSIMNDVSMRDWQHRTTQWMQGKNWEHSTPVGPCLVTPDELPGGLRPDVQITTEVNGELMQEARTGDLVFDPVELIRYVSTIVTLNPGDVIATGTPGGVGAARTPPRYLSPRDEVTCTIEGVGMLRNRIIDEVHRGELEA